MGVYRRGPWCRRCLTGRHKFLIYESVQGTPISVNGFLMRLAEKENLAPKIRQGENTWQFLKEREDPRVLGLALRFCPNLFAESD